MAPTTQQVLDKIVSLESLFEAGLSEIRKVRSLIQEEVSTSSTGQHKVKITHPDIIKLSALAVKKRNQSIKRKTQTL